MNGKKRLLEVVGTASNSLISQPNATERITNLPYLHNRKPTRASSEYEQLPWPSPFIRKNEGIYLVESNEEGESQETWLFSPIIIEARSCDPNGRNWGLLLNIQAPDKKWHQWIMPASLLGNSRAQYRETLFSFGLRISPQNFKYLHSYLATANPPETVTCVEKIGWHGTNFILPDETYSLDKSKLTTLIYSKKHLDNLFNHRGELKDWQEHIGQYCVDNSRLVFGASAAFAACIQSPCGHENCVLHFVGNSSIGKTTILNVAGSICGGGGQNGYLRRWRSTDNALEGTALAHNDCLLCLDEIGQLMPRAAAEIAYMLSNGQGKLRANKDGLACSTTEWRILTLSSGEISLEQKLQEEGNRFMAGQSVRVISIPADAGQGHGIFETLHNKSDGKTLSNWLQFAVSQFYGTPLRVFLNCFVSQLHENRELALSVIREFEKTACNMQADGQVKRVCRHFALIAAGGELAIGFEILPLRPGDAIQASLRCFHDWIAMRGGIGSAEAREALQRVRSFIAANRTSRFEPWERSGPDIIHNSVGFRRESGNTVEYLIYRDAFQKEICFGGNAKTIARYLQKAGFLTTDASGGLLKPHCPPRLGKTTRFYTIKSEILDCDL